MLAHRSHFGSSTGAVCWTSTTPSNEAAMLVPILASVAVGFGQDGFLRLAVDNVGAKGNATKVDQPDEPALKAAYDESTMSFHPNCEKCKLANLCPEGATAGTPECLPVVCKTICECRQGLPEPIAAPPIAILPSPEPDWTKAERMQFCACASSRRLTECTTQLCRQKVKSVLDIIQCQCAVPAPQANCPAWAQEGAVTR